MSDLLLTHEALAALVEELAAAGRPAVAPAWAGDAGRAAGAAGAARETEYRAVAGAAELALGERLPRLSLKQYFLPPTEVLFSWRRSAGEVELVSAPTDYPAQVVLGARPCDAAALPIVDHVMNWDYADELWNARRAATTVFSLACGVEDGSCFCSAVFLDPATERGSDGRLTPVEGGYLVETFTEKGAAFVAAHRASFAEPPAGGAGETLHEQAEGFRAAALERVAANLSLDHASLARLARPPLRRPLLDEPGTALPRLRRLHLGLPDVPLLRHRRRARERGPGRAPPQLGRLSDLCLHPPRLGPQPSPGSERALSPARRAQVPGVSGQVRGRPVHRLRPLLARLSHGPGSGRDPGRHRPAGRDGRRRVAGRCRRRGDVVSETPTAARQPQAHGAAEARRSGTIYQPDLVVVEAITDETPDTRTYRLRFKDPERAASFSFRAGQFGEYSVFGAGESTFCIASPPTRTGYLECTVKAAGKVTGSLREVDVGDVLGFRGPYGNVFPVEEWEGRDLVFIAGGIGLAPVRCVIWNVLDLRDRYGEVTIVYGARSVADLVYKRELEEWAGRADVRLRHDRRPRRRDGRLAGRGGLRDAGGRAG